MNRCWRIDQCRRVDHRSIDRLSRGVSHPDAKETRAGMDCLDVRNRCGSANRAASHPGEKVTLVEKVILVETSRRVASRAVRPRYAKGTLVGMNRQVNPRRGASQAERGSRIEKKSPDETNRRATLHRVGNYHPVIRCPDVNRAALHRVASYRGGKESRGETATLDEMNHRAAHRQGANRVIRHQGGTMIRYGLESRGVSQEGLLGERVNRVEKSRCVRGYPGANRAGRRVARTRCDLENRAESLAARRRAARTHCDSGSQVASLAARYRSAMVRREVRRAHHRSRPQTVGVSVSRPANRRCFLHCCYWMKDQNLVQSHRRTEGGNVFRLADRRSRRPRQKIDRCHRAARMNPDPGRRQNAPASQGANRAALLFGKVRQLVHLLLFSQTG